MFVVVLLAFFLPGLLFCAAVGLRGWRLAAVAPAVTFGLVATGGPVLAALGVRWNLLSFAVWTVATTVLLVVAVRLVARRRGQERRLTDAERVAHGAGPSRRSLWEQLTVAGGVVLGMAVGALVFLRGTGGLGVTSQEWDAPFHANAVRWIAEHGQAIPSAVAPIANLSAGDPYYYPITYHSLLALVVEAFGVSPSWALNAAALVVVLLWPLGIAALGLAWRVPAPVVAVAALVSTWFSAFPYDSLWRGPLWPYVAGLALLPGVLGAARMLIERRPTLPAGLTIALGVTGVISMHPSLAFVLLVYVLALAAALVFRLEPVRWRSAAVPLLVTSGLTLLVLLPVILPARTASGGVQGARWPEFASSPEGFGQVLLFSPVTTEPQWWLGLTALAGLVVMVRKRRLLWLVGAYVVFGAAYAATASMDNALVNLISGPFYNDAWRLAALLPLAGVFAVGEAVVGASTWLAPRVRLATSWPAVLGLSTAVLAVLAVLGDGAYVGRNVDRMGWTYGDGPTVSAAEEEAYAWLADHVQPGERVMNDRHDGSVWMYASAGVQPIEWTFYGAPAGSVGARLYEELNQMDHDPAIRRLLQQEDVRYVVVGSGFVRADMERAPGLKDLADVDGLEPVFHNRDAVVYEVVGTR